MKKELAFAIAAFAAACNRAPAIQPTLTLPPVPANTPYLTVEPTPTFPVLSREEISKSIEEEVAATFLDNLFRLLEHPDPAISGIYERLYLGQNEGALELNTSSPRFDIEGNLKNSSQEPPIICRFLPDGNFLIIVNTNFYSFRPSYPFEATAARLDGCLNFRDEVLKRYQPFLESNPDVALADALVLNPDWAPDSFLDAAYKTTAEILVPYQDRITSQDWLFNLFVVSYQKCEGESACWNEAIINYSDDFFLQL